MKALAIIFWIFAFVIFYTYVGYGMLAYLLVALKERFGKKSFHPTGEYKPDVTLLIAAYNEEDIIEEKMENCRSLIYPARETAHLREQHKRRCEQGRGFRRVSLHT